jgi:hypothetical protein
VQAYLHEQTNYSGAQQGETRSRNAVNYLLKALSIDPATALAPATSVDCPQTDRG